METNCPLTWGARAGAAGQSFVDTSGMFEFGFTVLLVVVSAVALTGLLIYAAYNVNRKFVDPFAWIMFALALALAMGDAVLLFVSMSQLARTLLACV
jgi:hypothetical protein